jgi:hypothetical protein
MTIILVAKLCLYHHEIVVPSGVSSTPKNNSANGNKNGSNVTINSGGANPSTSK